MWTAWKGKDNGRDIICEDVGGAVHIYQCGNYRKLTYLKAETTFTHWLEGARSKGAWFCLITGGTVSGSMKDKIRASASNAGFASSQVWSGAEFEEELRRDTLDLLLRFTHGVRFPKPLLPSLPLRLPKGAIRQVYRGCSHRGIWPASAQNPVLFGKAIAETIDALNTGKTPSGEILPAKNDSILSMWERRLSGLYNDTRCCG